MSLADYYKDNPGIYLVQTVRDLGILVVSNLMPVLRSWDERYEMWLTPEVIESFEKGILLCEEDCIVAFCEYLQTVPIPESELEAEKERGFFSTMDVYFYFYKSVMELDMKPTIKHAEDIFHRFFRAKPTIFPKDLVNSVEIALNECISSGKKQDLPGIFEFPKEFAVEKMRTEWFPKYLKSDRFAKLEEEVKQFLRLKNREKVRQELLDSP